MSVRIAMPCLGLAVLPFWSCVCSNFSMVMVMYFGVFG